MKLTELKIKDVAGIKELKLKFNEKMNFICGPNGIGKTTILECLGHTFTASGSKILKRNSISEVGSYTTKIEVNDNTINKTIEIKDFTPDKDNQISGLHQHSINIMVFKTHRTFNYQPLNSVSKDRIKDVHKIYTDAKDGIKINEVKNWFVNRYLYSAHKDSLTDEQLYNLELAKNLISIIDEDFVFNRIMASDNEIMINTPDGEVYYEYLSSGFKSVLSILLGIIKEIEFRFKSPTIKADEFDGVILIDELELHLHPSWQSKIANILKKAFPKIQFIVTTHSPHIIQHANANEIIALERTNSKVYQRQLINEEFGFKGWTIEEILSDIMGMEDTRTNVFQDILKKFELSIEAENYDDAVSSFSQLNQLLHPNNHLRELLKFDLISIKGLD